MDPLDAVFTDVYDLILQHFNAKDVIKCSMVSRSWYEIIGSSHNCMRNVCLHLEKPSHQLEALRKSQRRYEHFRIQPGSRGELAKVFKKFRPRTAVITDSDETDHGDFFDFMMSLAPSIEDLQPGEAATVNARKIKSIDFPKLRVLQYSVGDRNAFSIFQGSNPRLERVLLSFNAEISTDILLPTNIIHSFMQRNPQINHLWLCEFDGAFQCDLTKDVHLDLKTFAIAKTSLGLARNVADNLVKFIKAQKNLDWLKILCLHDENVFARIWNEGKFKRIFIMDCSLKGAMHSVELYRNDSIEEINFYLNPSCHILKFLRASPNLRAFKVRQLSKEILDFAASSLRCLETIQYQSVENGVEKLYDELKLKPSDKRINRNINLEEMDFFEYVGHDAGF